MKKQRFQIWLLALLIVLSPGPVFAAQSAVVFAYYRVGEDATPSGNLQLEQFTAHIHELENGGYHVMPLPDIVDALKNGEDLPDRTVALTFEGGYRSTLENAVPLLKKAKFPFTVFIAPDRMDRDTAYFLDWDELRKLKKNKYATIAALPATYLHLTELDETTLRQLLNRTAARFREELGEVPTLFGYPYGEYSPLVRKLISEQPYTAAFGQHSGVVSGISDFYTLPRFTMTDSFGGMDRFRLTATALPLGVSDVVPTTPAIVENPPRIGFTVTQTDLNLSELACFAAGQETPEIEILDGNRIELRLAEPFTAARGRINCTLPETTTAAGQPQRWHWLGMLFTVPEENPAPAQQ